MHRRPLLDLLDRYERAYPAETARVMRIGDLARAHTDCFERTCLPGHLTASAWIVSEDRERCLLTHHRKLGRWLQLGGHADGDPDLLATALREAREESGMAHFSCVGSDDRESNPGVPSPPVAFDLDIHMIPPHGGDPAHEHHDVRFLLVARDGQALALSDESIDLRWFRLDELGGLDLDESVLRLARKAAAAARGG